MRTERTHNIYVGQYHFLFARPVNDLHAVVDLATLLNLMRI